MGSYTFPLHKVTKLKVAEHEIAREVERRKKLNNFLINLKATMDK